MRIIGEELRKNGTEAEAEIRRRINALKQEIAKAATARQQEIAKEEHAERLRFENQLRKSFGDLVGLLAMEIRSENRGGRYSIRVRAAFKWGEHDWTLEYFGNDHCPWLLVRQAADAKGDTVCEDYGSSLDRLPDELLLGLDELAQRSVYQPQPETSATPPPEPTALERLNQALLDYICEVVDARAL